MNFLSKIKSRIFTKTQPVAGGQHGLAVLNKFLCALELKLGQCNDEKIVTEMLLLKAGIGEVIRQAYTDWNTFSNKYTCFIGYSENIETSNVFSLSLTEVNGGLEKRFSFRF